jgi:uncharacterized protein involved in outer membrane biogenesis
MAGFAGANRRRRSGSTSLSAIRIFRPLDTIGRMRFVPVFETLRRLCTLRRLLALALLVALVAGALAVPEQARRYGERALAQVTGGQARLAAVAIDPWRLALRVDGLHLTDPAGALLLAADSIDLDLAANSLWTRSLHLESVLVHGARGWLQVLENGVIRHNCRPAARPAPPRRTCASTASSWPAARLPCATTAPGRQPPWR